MASWFSWQTKQSRIKQNWNLFNNGTFSFHSFNRPETNEITPAPHFAWNLKTLLFAHIASYLTSSHSTIFSLVKYHHWWKIKRKKSDRPSNLNWKWREKKKGKYLEVKCVVVRQCQRINTRQTKSNNETQMYEILYIYINKNRKPNESKKELSGKI